MTQSDRNQEQQGASQNTQEQSIGNQQGTAQTGAQNAGGENIDQEEDQYTKDLQQSGDRNSSNRKTGGWLFVGFRPTHHGRKPIFKTFYVVVGDKNNNGWARSTVKGEKIEASCSSKSTTPGQDPILLHPVIILINENLPKKRPIFILKSLNFSL